MKEMSLKDIQNVSLDIMKYVHSVCEQNNIRYSLAYGSLIGAIRHHGFIPWDDDLDIILPREEYNKLLQCFKNTEKYKLFAPSLGNSYTAYARVCEMQDTLVIPDSPCFTEPTGVWIDIFPLDHLPDNDAEYWACLRKMMRSFKYIQHRRGAMYSFDHYDKWYYKFRLLVRKMIFRGDPIELARKHEAKSQMLAPNDTKSLGQMAFIETLTRDRRYPASIFNSVFEVDFEGEKFYSMEGYDAYLTRRFGDWMTPPPENERKRVHLIHQFYWK